MRPFILKCLSILVFSFASKNLVYAQLHSFGSNALQTPLTNYKFTVYGYYDFIREAGLGFQYQLNPSVSFDGSLFSVRPNTKVKGSIRETDYFDFGGAGIAVKAKYHFSRHSHWYIGLGFSVEYLEHGAIEVEHGEGDYDPYYTRDECYGYSRNASVTFGTKGAIGQVCVEPYLVLGAAGVNVQRTTYSATGRYANNTFPYTEKVHELYFNLSIGLKMGFAFKKNKKQAAINQKFDNTFIPAYTSLYNRMASIPHERLRASRSLKKANTYIRTANRRFLKIYKRNYSDTSYMYREFDNYLKNAHRLINAENDPDDY